MSFVASHKEPPTHNVLEAAKSTQVVEGKNFFLSPRLPAELLKRGDFYQKNKPRDEPIQPMAIQVG
jgi:hypothetical protein